MRLLQAAYYLVSGLWPIVSLRTFEAITGEKREDWLVKTVGALVAVIGLVLGVGALRRSTAPELNLLALGSSISLAIIDIRYYLAGRLSWAYPADALAEVVFALAAGRRLMRPPAQGHPSNASIASSS